MTADTLFGWLRRGTARRRPRAANASWSDATPAAPSVDAPPAAAPAAAPAPAETGTRRRRRRLRLASMSLTRRILAINLIVLAVPVASFLFLDEYQQGLVDAELEKLRVQGEIYAGALGGSAVAVQPGFGQRLNPRLAGQLLLRLVEPTETRARLFAPAGELLADTRALSAPRGVVQIERLPPPAGEASFVDAMLRAVGGVADWLPGARDLPGYFERRRQHAGDYDEVTAALRGYVAGEVRSYRGGMVLSVAVPVQRYRQIVGALMLTGGSGEIERAMAAVRLDILRVSAVALAITVLLSLYLAGTIARPLRRLADAAERVRRGQGREGDIPDFSARGDEIGELSGDLREMTAALRARMNAIERFAADVAHEIKNPLTSLRSAVETVARVDGPAQQRRLMSIILDDVSRLDRLISDISDASRLDAELAREAAEPVDLGRLLGTLADIERTTRSADATELVVELPAAAVDAALTVRAIEGRLGQVFRNIISNAASFSPPGGRIDCRVRRETRREAARVRDVVLVTIDDDGPGIPEANHESIFRRFYSDRPDDDGKAGSHSGLGLSISRQIVETAGGRLWAENRRNAAGAIVGARFCVELPAA